MSLLWNLVFKKEDAKPIRIINNGKTISSICEVKVNGMSGYPIKLIVDERCHWEFSLN
ncbi:hypothetical protein HPT25_03420 [Bacillus sp. BRMEA1]|nr:hypothetical protein [Neobacillus endophyticus]